MRFNYFNKDVLCKETIGKERIIRTLCILPRHISGYWYWLHSLRIRQRYHGSKIGWVDLEILKEGRGIGVLKP